MSSPKCQSKTQNPSELLTTKEAAAIAGVSGRRLQKWVEASHFRAVQRHPKVVFDLPAFEQFLCDRTPPPQEAAASAFARVRNARGACRGTPID